MFDEMPTKRPTSSFASPAGRICAQEVSVEVRGHRPRQVARSSSLDRVIREGSPRCLTTMSTSRSAGFCSDACRQASSCVNVELKAEGLRPILFTVSCGRTRSVGDHLRSP